MARLAILGGGFMGGALAQGLVESGWQATDILVAEKLEDRRRALEEGWGLQTTADIERACSEARTVLFAVKPQDLRGVLSALAPHFTPEHLALSICAGVRTETFEEFLEEVPVVRAMPNTPAAIRKAATAIAPGRYAGKEHLRLARQILEAVGEVVVVDEGQLDAVTAVSGSGPAYIFLVAEALLDAAREQGLTEDQARTLVYQTLEGAVGLLRNDPAEPAELRARVTSPGGTTQAAIEHLQAGDWEKRLRDAVARARTRSEELAG